MALPFRRSNQGDEGAPTCSFSSPMQRLWEVQVVLCTLSPEVHEALFIWLFNPTDLRRWQPPARFTRGASPSAPTNWTRTIGLPAPASSARRTQRHPPDAWTFRPKR